MSFLNATLTLGTLAIAAPIVLHLIARREPKKVTFPSIAFLTKRFESNRSRLRVRRWWLLAMRIAAIAVFAIALARPAIHQSLSITWLSIGFVAAAGIALLIMATIAVTQDRSRGLRYGLAGTAVSLIIGSMLWATVTYASGPSVAIDDSGPIAVAIVIDNSPTAAWQTADDDRMQRMIDVATGVIARLPRTSRVAVVDRSTTPATFSLDVAGAISKLESIAPSVRPVSIFSRIDSAARLLRTSDLENKQLLLLTDLAKGTWADVSDAVSMSETMADVPTVSLTVFDTGEFVGSNRSLSELKLADPSPPKDSPVALTVTLQSEKLVGTAENDTDTGPSSESVTAELQIYQVDGGLPVVRDGNVIYPKMSSVDRTAVNIQNGQAVETLLTIPGLPMGIHHGRVRIVGRDAMRLDDERFFTINVLAPSSVLLVSNDADEARVIDDAITASANAGTSEVAEFIVERIEFADLSVARLSDYDAVMLLDPPQDSLNDEAVATYVASGGGLMTAIGPSSAATIQSSLASLDPAKFPWLPSVVRSWRVPDQGTFLQVTDRSSVITDSLDGDTPWNDFRVAQYWQVTPADGDDVLMRYAGTDHPAMVLRQTKSEAGNPIGRSLVLTTPLPALSKRNRDWNELFGIDPWPAWLLTRQSVDYLTGRRGSEAMTMVGGIQTVRVDRQSGQTDQASESFRLQLFPPDGSPPIPMDTPKRQPDNAAIQVTITDIRSPGIHWIKGAQPGLGFSANMPDGAIDLDRIGKVDLDTSLGQDSFLLATDPSEIRLADRRSDQRISLTSPAMLLALIVFLLEQVLGNRFYRHR